MTRTCWDSSDILEAAIEELLSVFSCLKKSKSMEEAILINTGIMLVIKKIGSIGRMCVNQVFNSEFH